MQANWRSFARWLNPPGGTGNWNCFRDTRTIRNLKSRRRPSRRMPRERRFTTRGWWTESCLRTIPGWWCRRWAARREYYPRAMPGRARATSSESPNCLEMKGLAREQRGAYFVCVIAAVRGARALAIVSEKVDGEILGAPRGSGGFGYDPVFFFPPLGKTFAELQAEQKNLHSHRGKAFRRLMEVLE